MSISSYCFDKPLFFIEPESNSLSTSGGWGVLFTVFVTPLVLLYPFPFLPIGMRWYLILICICPLFSFGDIYLFPLTIFWLGCFFLCNVLVLFVCFFFWGAHSAVFRNDFISAWWILWVPWVRRVIYWGKSYVRQMPLNYLCSPLFWVLSVLCTS